jgi:hypothetical protein
MTAVNAKNAVDKCLNAVKKCENFVPVFKKTTFLTNCQK